MKKFLYFLFMCIMISSCSDERDCGCSGGQYITNIKVSINDEQGNTLLENVEYQENNFSSYFFRNGILNSLSQPVFYNAGDTQKVLIHLNTDELEEFPVTYVRWNENDTDTIKAKFLHNENSIILDQAWINNQEFLDLENVIITK